MPCRANYWQPPQRGVCREYSLSRLSSNRPSNSQKLSIKPSEMKMQLFSDKLAIDKTKSGPRRLFRVVPRSNTPTPGLRPFCAEPDNAAALCVHSVCRLCRYKRSTVTYLRLSTLRGLTPVLTRHHAAVSVSESALRCFRSPPPSTFCCDFFSCNKCGPPTTPPPHRPKPPPPRQRQR